MPTVVKPARRPPPSPPKRKGGRAAVRRNPPPPAPRAARAEGVPGWAELAGKVPAASARKRERAPSFVEALSILRVALLLLAVCAAVTLYLAHQYASQSLVQEVQELRRENLRLVLQHNRLRGEYDQMTAPAVILRRADALGLRPSADYAPTILIE